VCKRRRAREGRAPPNRRRSPRLKRDQIGQPKHKTANPTPIKPTQQREEDGAALFMPREAADPAALAAAGGEINSALTNPFFGAL
jgi:hypothetical protein